MISWVKQLERGEGSPRAAAVRLGRGLGCGLGLGWRASGPIRIILFGPN